MATRSPRGRDPDGVVMTAEDSSLVADSSSLLYTEIYVPTEYPSSSSNSTGTDAAARQEDLDRAVAETLQRQFDESLSADDILDHITEAKDLDAAVAEALQRQFDESFANRRERESELDMRSTATGKALSLTQRMLAHHDQIMAQFLAHPFDGPESEHPAHMFQLVNADDMVFGEIIV